MREAFLTEAEVIQQIAETLQEPIDILFPLLTPEMEKELCEDLSSFSKGSESLDALLATLEVSEQVNETTLHERSIDTYRNEVERLTSFEKWLLPFIKPA